MTKLTDAEWEALCDGCGKCCSLGNTCFACPSLDVPTKRCTVYEKRTETEMCVKVTPENVLTLHGLKILPDTCGYVRNLNGLKPFKKPPEYPLIPFDRAPKSFRRAYEDRREAWLLGDRDEILAEREADRGDRRQDAPVRRSVSGDTADAESGAD